MQKNIVIDTNLLLDTFRDRTNISQISRDSIINFLKFGNNYTLIIAGSKMLNELQEKNIKNGIKPDNFLNLLKLLQHYESYSNGINIEIEKDNKKIDKEICNFFQTCKIWEKMKKTKNPIKDYIAGDPHIVYILDKYKVKILCTRDQDLVKKTKQYFSQFSIENKIAIYCLCNWKIETFNLCKELKISLPLN